MHEGEEEGGGGGSSGGGGRGIGRETGLALETMGLGFEGLVQPTDSTDFVDIT